MPADVLSRGGIAALTLVVLAAGCGGGGSSDQPIKIAFVTDCAPPFGSSDRQPAVAGAELPLLQRGARLQGPEPSNGVTEATVAGRPVRLLLACEAYGDFTSLLATLRRLVENEGADIVVGPSNTPEGLVIKQYAKRHPAITFSTTSGEQSTTLRQPAPNLFRFALDGAQATAGLGAYAYRTFGWRNAVTVGEDDPAGWPEVAGFAAEFCSLGGHVQLRWTSQFNNFGPVVAKIPATGVDGVVFPSDLLPAKRFIAAWAKRYRRPGEHLLVNADPDSKAFTRPLPVGIGRVVGVSTWPLTPTPDSRRFVAASTRWFGDTDTKRNPVTDAQADYNSYDEMEPVLEALGHVHSDLSHGERRFQKELARLHFQAPNGETSLDSRRQAIAPVYLDKVERNAQGKLIVRQIGVVPHVEQTFGGYFTPAMLPPGRHPACKRGKPPAWVTSGSATR